MSQQSFAIVLDPTLYIYIYLLYPTLYIYIYIFFFYQGTTYLRSWIFYFQLSAVGDYVAEDESVGEIETDKVSLW